MDRDREGESGHGAEAGRDTERKCLPGPDSGVPIHLHCPDPPRLTVINLMPLRDELWINRNSSQFIAVYLRFTHNMCHISYLIAHTSSLIPSLYIVKRLNLILSESVIPSSVICSLLETLSHFSFLARKKALFATCSSLSNANSPSTTTDLFPLFWGSLFSHTRLFFYKNV